MTVSQSAWRAAAVWPRAAAWVFVPCTCYQFIKNVGRLTGRVASQGCPGFGMGVHLFTQLTHSDTCIDTTITTLRAGNAVNLLDIETKSYSSRLPTLRLAPLESDRYRYQKLVHEQSEVT